MAPVTTLSNQQKQVKKMDILDKIKTVLGMTEEVTLKQMKLKDGLTIVEAESFVKGDMVSIITEDGKIPVAPGTYVLEDDREFTVVEEGIIDSITEVEEVEEPKAEEPAEEPKDEEAKKEEDKEQYNTEINSPKKVIETVSKEMHFNEVEKLNKEIETLKAELSKINEAKEVELKEEAPKRIKYNPEAKKEVEGFRFAKNRPPSIMDTVIRRINND